VPKYVRLTTAEKRKRLKERRIAKGLEEKPKPGPKRKTADPVSLEEMAAMQCTQEEMAAVLGMSVKTFQNRLKDDPEFADAVERGKQRGKVSLRRLQMQHAEGEGGPAVNMTIHLSKHVLGQFDKPVDTHSTVDINVNTNNAGERIAATRGCCCRGRSWALTSGRSDAGS
jgi:hypothetical protein